MIYIKLIVLFVYVLYSSCFNNYCEICRNHTLCLFNEGPSVACKSYNNTALLRRVEINEIVNRINERRNYIALGLNKNLPQAANMKKISWSSKLAAFAQRWVDQCDPSLQLDKEDQCRDLAHIKVGQNVATILGPTSGLNVKSFVEMWYIQILKYKGDVTYYNQSRHHNTDYFTQLIWAETDSVGCGKARLNSRIQ
ncbi:venom allergen 5 isoform X5 [Manduca sexta]|uniref:venom allergen 5 isoform X5 n=1 Tax=Manduca sexta TaxID=7130 RepID=UPI0018909FCF|nr:venom allergen 5 isoform X5 [Manduca sexta]